MRSLQWRLLIPLSVFLALSLSALGLFLAISYRNDQLDNIRERLAQEASLVAHAVQPGLGEGAATDSLIKDLGETTDIRLTIISPDGTVLADSLENPADMENHLDRPEVRDALATGYGESTRYSTTLNYDTTYVAVAIKNTAGQTLGVSRVALPLSEVHLATDRILGTAALAVAVALGAMIAGVWVVSRSITSPIVQLTHDVKRLTGGEVGATTKVSGRDEIGVLGHVFNTMSLRLAGVLGQLAADKNRLEAILSHIADGVVLSDNEGLLVIANTAAARIFSFDEQEATGRPVIEALRDHEADEMLRQALREGRETSNRFESMVNHRYLQAIAVPLVYGETSGVLLLFQDLTEIRELQTMRKELIGNISHEFRTPLAGIRAIVETLEDGALNEPEVARDFLRKTRGEVDRLTQMVSELTELSRIETGHTMLELKPTNINLLLQEAMARFSPQSERQQLIVTTHFDPATPLVPVDAPRLMQAITNILHNAIKFTPPGGKITLSSRPSPAGVTISVADTGSGISAADLPHVFDRFYKADKSRSGTGTGLGLAIAKHAVLAHGGHIRAESEPGKGSTFSIDLPLAA